MLLSNQNKTKRIPTIKECMEDAYSNLAYNIRSDGFQITDTKALGNIVNLPMLVLCEQWDENTVPNFMQSDLKKFEITNIIVSYGNLIFFKNLISVTFQMIHSTENFEEEYESSFDVIFDKNILKEFPLKDQIARYRYGKLTDIIVR
jgi:hypothetical protein|nr:MAG TPA: hypothetical protein [Caudoviricetes sp.]